MCVCMYKYVYIYIFIYLYIQTPSNPRRMQDGVIAPQGRLNLGEFGTVTCAMTAALVAHVPVPADGCVNSPRGLRFEYRGLQNQ